MKISYVRIFVVSICFAIVSVPLHAAEHEVTVMKLKIAPTVDGNADDWKQGESFTIPLNGKIGIKEVTVKAGVHGDTVYFLWQWKDTTADTQHKPYEWDNGKKKYVAGPQREDRFAVNFAMEGDFTEDWLSGKTFKADMWHWKAARTNPNGLAHDKMTIITNEQTKKAYKATAQNGSIIYIKRPGDEGDKLYSTKRYAVKEKDMMPKYILTENPKGSVADVKAKGVWGNGMWTLEESRLLDTGHGDDVVFKPGISVDAAIAVFDHTGDEHHDISKTVAFHFPK